MRQQKQKTFSGVLVGKSKTKYDLLKAQGTWGAASKEMENIMVLHAQIEQVASTNLKLSKHLTKKQVTYSTTGKTASNDSSKIGKGQQAGGKKKKNKKDTSNKKKQKKDEA